MPTVLQINATANSTSTGKIAEDIGKLVTNKGWRSIIAYGRWANPSKSELIRIGSGLTNKEHWLENRLFDNQGLASRTPTKKFIQQIKEIKPDVIHLHNVHGYYLNYKLLFEYLSSINTPVIWTLHDCWTFTGHCAYFDFSGCERWEKGCYAPCPCKGDYPKAIFNDRSEKNWRQKYDYFRSKKEITIIPVSDWLAELVNHSFLNVYPISVIHNGIDINVFKPSDSTIIRTKYNIGEARYLLGVANVWDRRKGLPDYIKLAQELPLNTKIVLVGLKPMQIEEVKKYGIIGIPRTENVEDLIALYSSAEALLSLTYEDNYPTTNLEAMACGTPVITYKTGGSPEAISGETGWVVDKGDFKSVLGILKYMPNHNDVMKRACRSRAELLFDKDKCFEEYIRMYESLLQ